METIRVNADLKNYYLCPKTLYKFLQHQNLEVINFPNCFLSNMFWDATAICRDCAKQLREGFALRCSACYINEVWEE